MRSRSGGAATNDRRAVLSDHRRRGARRRGHRRVGASPRRVRLAGRAASQAFSAAARARAVWLGEVMPRRTVCSVRPWRATRRARRRPSDVLRLAPERRGGLVTFAVRRACASATAARMDTDSGTTPGSVARGHRPFTWTAGITGLAQRTRTTRAESGPIATCRDCIIAGTTASVTCSGVAYTRHCTDTRIDPTAIHM